MTHSQRLRLIIPKRTHIHLAPRPCLVCIPRLLSMIGWSLRASGLPVETPGPSCPGIIWVPRAQALQPLLLGYHLPCGAPAGLETTDGRFTSTVQRACCQTRRDWVSHAGPWLVIQVSGPACPGSSWGAVGEVPQQGLSRVITQQEGLFAFSARDPRSGRAEPTSQQTLLPRGLSSWRWGGSCLLEDNQP